MYRDILVVGAGVLGLCSAYHLKKENPEKSLLLIESLDGPGHGNTAKAAGIYLNLHSSKINYLLADTTIDWFYHLQNDLDYNLNLAQYGYLYLLNKVRYNNVKESISEMRSNGVNVKTFEKEDLKHMIPDLIPNFDDEDIKMMGLESIDIGVLGVKCGGINTDALAHCLEAEIIKLGGEIIYNTTATKLVVKPKKELGISGEPFVWQDIQVMGAETTRGKINAKSTVVATGAWSERLLDPIGFDSMMRPKKRVIFVFNDSRLHRLMNSKGFSQYNVLPFTHIPKINTYMKVEQTEGSLWLGCSEDFGREYGLEEDLQAERNLYLNNIYHALVKYLPCFKDVRHVNMWAGFRSINRYDATPVVSLAPGMIYVGSATGKGITKCDALGRTVAAIYGDKQDVELYGGLHFKASRLGIETRDVEKETFNL
jgi:glycine/D-amino acid oxidase-like deaminating enzyme